MKFLNKYYKIFLRLIMILSLVIIFVNNPFTENKKEYSEKEIKREFYGQVVNKYSNKGATCLEIKTNLGVISPSYLSGKLFKVAAIGDSIFKPANKNRCFLKKGNLYEEFQYITVFE